MTMTRRDAAKMNYDFIVNMYQWTYDLTNRWNLTDEMTQFRNVFDAALEDTANMYDISDSDYDRWEAYGRRLNGYLDELSNLSADQWF